jgi:hypothetical protein
MDPGQGKLFEIPARKRPARHSRPRPRVGRHNRPAAPKLLEVPGPFCPGCPLRDCCRAPFTEKTCTPYWGRPELGGLQALHPGFSLTYEYLDLVDGPEFSTVSASRTPDPELPIFVSQVRMRRALRGQLHSSWYAITAGQVIGKRGRPLTAAQVRSCIGLDHDKRLILLLYGSDKFLEHLWNNRERFLAELAEGGFELIVAPSYSQWEPRPRPEHLWAAKRSLWVFGRLHELGAPVIPRVCWAVPGDAIRWAEWFAENPRVSLASLDLTTYRGEAVFAEQLELLGEFDRKSGRRVSFIVNGPSKLERAAALFERVDPDRVHLTNSRAIARDGLPGTTYAEKEETEREVILAARRTAIGGRPGPLGTPAPGSEPLPAKL